MTAASPSTIIVGGGPAGAAAAIRLARAGAPVTLFERTPGPHDKVCGDFLGGPAVGLLADLGIEPGALGAAPIARVSLIAGTVTAHAPLPFPAYGLSRRVLDETLLEGAAAAGACVSRGQAVRGLRVEGSRIALGHGGGWLRAETVLLATGKHDLHGMPRPAHGQGAVGLKIYATLAPAQAAALAGTVEIVLLPDGGYAGLQMVEAGQAVLCVMRPRDRMRAGGRDRLLEALASASPHLRRRLAGAAPAGDRAVAVAGVPYGHLHAPSPDDPPTLFRLGDQAAVIPSLAGEGIAIALSSAALAARCALAGADSHAYHRQLRARLRRPMRVAMAAHRLAGNSLTQAWLLRACRLCPGLIGFTATRTRC